MKSIVIADDNAAFTKEMENFFSATGGYSVVGVAADGLEAVSMVEKYKPDFLLLDIVMPELDGFGVMSALNCDGYKPSIIVISQLATDGFIGKSLKYGADYFMAKPVSFEKLKDYMDDMKGETPALPKPATAAKSYVNRSLDEKIANIFISVGIPAHIKGYQFLREAIKMAIATPDIINRITKSLYPAIAEKFDTSPSKVERAIRHAIEVAWNRGKIENINMIFGLKIYSANDKPTNGEFIALRADKICLEGAYSA